MEISSLLITLILFPSIGSAQGQKKPWATLCNGTLTFLYGYKPTIPSKIFCPMCNKSMAYSDNYCGNCGRKNSKGFTVYEVPLSAQETDIRDYFEKKEIEGIMDRIPWHKRLSEVKRVSFDYSFRQVNSIISTSLWFFSKDENNTIQFFTGLENLNTTNVKYMAFMFSGCAQVYSLDLSKFDTRNVKDMTGMFGNCSLLSNINLQGWNTANVKNMSFMFLFCERLTSLDLSGFSTVKVTRMSSMFMGCRNLSSLKITNFNTDNVIDMSYMFYNCEKLPFIDLSSFNTKKTEATICMFKNCNELRTIYASTTKWNLSRAKNNKHANDFSIWWDSYNNGTDDMFENCPAKVVWR